jgi:hypothetical protein
VPGGAVAHRGEVDDHRDVLVAAASVAPHVLIDPEHPHPVVAHRIGDQHAAAFVEHCGVRAVPRHCERLRDPRHREVLTDQTGERPRESAAGDLRLITIEGVVGV